MTLESLLQVASFGMETAIMVSAPVLLCGLTAGVLVSVFQAATQINDAALAFIPKIAAVVLSLMIFGPWMISRMVSFSIWTLSQIPAVTN
ncbi:MAG TPA: flagellar biosynthetic protein FliQ [Oligoflexia bacterium]|nr:flagellar biosynthetic protein FliQ [Oligoflexia bacterium]